MEDSRQAATRGATAGTVALLTSLALGTEEAGTAVGAVAVQGAVEIVHGLQTRGRRRGEVKQAAVLHACATALGLSDEVLAAALGEDDALLTASRKILDAADETAWIAKLAVLGELLASAARDGADPRAARLHVESAAVADLEEPHAMLLDTIALRREPEPPDGYTGWSYDQLLKELPYDEGVLDSLLATLTRHGLAYDAAAGTAGALEGIPFYVASNFGRHMLNVFRQAAESVRAAQDAAG